MTGGKNDITKELAHGNTHYLWLFIRMCGIEKVNKKVNYAKNQLDKNDGRGI